MEKLLKFEFQKHDLWYQKYNQYWIFSVAKKGYSGCCTLSKEKPLSVEYGFGESKFDCEGRSVTLEFKDFFLVNVYVPNAKSGLARIDERLEFNSKFKDYLGKLKEKKMTVVVGDFNVAHLDKDVAFPEKKKPTQHGFSPQEKKAFQELLDSGFKDTWREFHPDKIQYTWWDARHKHDSVRDVQGWRIDYALVDSENFHRVQDVEQLTGVFGSDHCPVTITIDLGKQKEEKVFAENNKLS